MMNDTNQKASNPKTTEHAFPGPHDISRHELANGLIVLIRENHASPSVVVRGYINAGARDEDPTQPGLAAFTASTLMRGTANHRFEDIYGRLESVGASLSIGSGTFTTSFGGQSLVDDLPLLLDTLSDVLRHPAFPAEMVEKRRGEILTDLEERAQDTQRQANLAFHELAYPPDHPYARSLNGYPESVKSIGRDDLARFHAQGYGPQDGVITLVGAVETSTALHQIEAALGSWEGPTFDRSPLPEVSQIAETRTRTISIAGKTQSDIVLGYPGPPRTAPDYPDAVVCNSILGIFGLMGRLGENVRDRQGLAYYSYSRVDGGVGPGPWRVIAGVNPKNVDQAISSIRDEIRRICQEPVEVEELQDNRAFITGSLPLRLETNNGVARYILEMELYDLGLDYLQRYTAIIEEITVERVQAVAQRWLDADTYALAIAGPPSE